MKIGLVLSGGGIRGVAHLGILKALTDKGLKIDYITGASAGAIAGALYANGIEPYEALQIFKKLPLLKLVKLAFGRPALLNLESSYSIFREHLGHDSFEELKIPLSIAVTNFNEGKPEFVSSGSLINVIMASASIPGIFNPIVINDTLYNDGGILNNFPVQPLINHCDFIIGASCNNLRPIKTLRNMKHALERAATLAINRHMIEKLEHIDVLLDPPGIGEIGIFEFSKAEDIFWLAHEYTLQKIQESEKLAEIIEACK